MSLHLVSFILAILSASKAGQIENKIYDNLKYFQQCILLTNATHQVGCTSDMNGNRGTLHFIDSDEDLQWLIKKGSHTPYIPLLNASMFTRPVMDKLMESKKISGVLMIHEPKTQNPTEFSPEDTCPLDNFGIYSGHKEYGDCQKVKWNPVGNGMSFVYYGIPIFSLTSRHEIDALIKCFRKHNDPKSNKTIDYPLCAVEMKDFMFAAKDTPTCMRKTEAPNLIGSTYCDPLEDKNVYGFLEPLSPEVDDGEVIMATTKMDSTAFFHDIALGADNGVTGIVTLLGAAFALGNYKRELSEKSMAEKLRPVLFSFFNGEAFDYIGSSKMVFDMQRNSFPYKTDYKDPILNITNDDAYISKFNLSKVGYFLEVGQVGQGNDIFLHTDPISQQIPDIKSKTQDLLKLIKTQSQNVSLNMETVENGQPLPPASFQRFLRAQNISGVVFTDHKNKFTNNYYNSRFDNTRNLDIYLNTNTETNETVKLHGPLIDRLNKLSIALANTLYRLASDGREPSQNITLDKSRTGNLLYCFLYSANCPAFKEILNDKETKPFSNTPISRYISVGQIKNTITTVLTRLISYYTGDWKKGKCQSKRSELPYMYSYSTVKGEFVDDTYTCVKSVSFTTPAVSPSFELKDYASTEYSTWTESMWSGDVGVRLYMVANPTNEIIVLVVGIVMLLSSIAFVYFIKKNAHILFTPSIVVINQ
ncbi:nicastrin-like [Clytia hemisphaerica]|uniref:Nicastrin n=1 Tax=Clytia hemisphaerica TaxID=252671 RepID=A0A7M5UWW3_9CNID